MAASAAYPALLPALDRKYRFTKKGRISDLTRVLLTDGGVFENLGVAVIEHADPNVSVARVNVGSQLQTMSDAAVLDLFNAMMGAQENLAAEFDSTAVEIPPGKPQVRFVEDSAQWVPRGRVLRCHIEDDENGETVIYIDDRAFDLAEFGGLLRFFTGWGMRITFVPEDQVTEQPKIEVREPEDEED